MNVALTLTSVVCLELTCVKQRPENDLKERFMNETQTKAMMGRGRGGEGRGGAEEGEGVGERKGRGGEEEGGVERGEEGQRKREGGEGGGGLRHTSVW